jgi:hypothetical protein
MLSYLSATRHPWASLVFVLPWVLVYEGGVILLTQGGATGLRGGADEWLRLGLAQYGLGQAWVAPLILLGVLVTQCVLSWKGRPREPLAVVFGMTLESVAFAGVLWALARNFNPLLESWGVPLASIRSNVTTGEVLRYIGAGIYEEVLFRLGLFTLLYYLLRVALLPKFVALGLAAVAAAFAFAAAHHVGPHGEPVVAPVFLFRMTAGLFFTALYVGRGFGVAVGTHALYDILAGVSVE